MVCTSILHYLNMHMITVLEMQIHIYNTISNEMQCVESHSNSVLICRHRFAVCNTDYEIIIGTKVLNPRCKKL